MVHYLTNINSHFMRWLLQIFPMHIKELNAVVHQDFWSVAETYFRNYSIAAVWVFTWFLEVENSFNSEHFHLVNNIKFFNQTVTQSLRANYQIFNPFRMQTVNCWVVTIFIVFVLAPFPHAGNSTVNLCCFVKFTGFKFARTAKTIEVLGF